MAIIEKYLSLLITPDGGLSPEGVRLALELEQVPLNQREEMALKMTAYAAAVIAASRGETFSDKEEQNGQKSPD
jgi:hypothetical protein